MKKLLLIFLLIAAWSVQAREVYPLCDDWLFSFRYENSSDNARCVTLPHTWNLDALAGTIPYLRTTADYQRKLYVPQTWTGKAALPEILRRGERRPPLRKRNLRRRAPGRNDRFRLRNHRPGEIRQRKPASRSREQRHYGRRAAALVHPQHLRRHQPGGRTHRHRPHRRIASVSGLVGSPDPPSGRIDRTGRSPRPKSTSSRKATTSAA